MFSHADVVALERSVAEESLAEFIQMAWPVLEPGTPYLHNWHMDAVSEHLEATATGQIPRLLINVPPGTSKSSAASVFFPAWLWGPAKKPHFRFIGAAHEQGLATRDNRRTRLLVESDWYQERWPTPITSDQNEKTFFENEQRGFRQSSSVTGITGKRGHVVVWDDPHNPEGATSDVSRETTLRIFYETLPLRVVDPSKSAIIVIMQRLHQDDVSGYILENELGYEHLMLPMEFEPERRCYTVLKPRHMDSAPQLMRYDVQSQRWQAPVVEMSTDELVAEGYRTVHNQDPREEPDELLFKNRFPRVVVDRDKKVLRPYGVAGQFQQRPTPRGGGQFKSEWFNTIPAIPSGYIWVRGWDLSGASKKTLAKGQGAYTAGVLVGRSPTTPPRFCVANVKRKRGTPAEIERLIVNTAKQDAAVVPGVRGSLPQDPGQAGKSQADYLIGQLAGFAYRATPESGDKISRADPVAAQAEIGSIDIVAGDWNRPFLDELELFPAGKYADQVDALSRAFNEVVNHRPFEWHVSGDDE